MDCPVCKVTLQRSERQGIEIDYCPRCRGVWLDRGELDKIIELAGEEMAAMTTEGTPVRPSFSSAEYRRDEHPGEPGKGTRARRSLLSDLFD